MHGNASLEIIASAFTPMLVGADPLEPRVIQDRLFHEHIKVGPEGAYAGALAAIDVALWDLRGKVLGPAQVKIRFASRSRSTRTTATPSRARSASGARWRSSATCGSR